MATTPTTIVSNLNKNTRLLEASELGVEEELDSKHEIDKLIKKFTYSIKHQEQREQASHYLNRSSNNNNNKVVEVGENEEKIQLNNINNKNKKYHNKIQDLSTSLFQFKSSTEEEASLSSSNLPNSTTNNRSLFFKTSNNFQNNNNNTNSSAALLLLSNNFSNIKKNKSNFNLNSTTITNRFNSATFHNNRNTNNNNNKLIESVESSSNDKALFFNTLKSLFAIFDPECRGSIDLAELNTLGASKNEILSDVINHLFTEKKKSLNYSQQILLTQRQRSEEEESVAANNNNLASNNKHNLNGGGSSSAAASSSNNSSSCSSRSSSANSNRNLFNGNTNTNKNKHSFRINNPITNQTRPIHLLIDEKKIGQADSSSSTSSSVSSLSANRLTFIKNNLKENNTHKEARSPSANQINKKFKLNSNFQQLHEPILINNNASYYVSFEEFAQAAELILDKRKREKHKMYQQHQQNYSKSPMRPASNFNQLNDQYSTIVTVQPPPPIAAPPASHQRIVNANLSRPNILTNNKANYTTLPIVNANHNVPPPVVISNGGATLSQAFENVTNKSKNINNLNNNIKTLNESNTMKKSDDNFNTSLLKNANSLDLGNLIEKEQFLLKQGLNDLDLIKQWYGMQLKENKLKQQNVHKLKHQNLFSIDKMLIDLKHLNDMNSNLRAFLTNTIVSSTTSGPAEQEVENLEMDLSTATSNSSSTHSQKENFFMNQQTLAAAASAAEAAISNTSQVQPSLPSYQEYLEQFELNKTDTELDVYLKQKQERIDNLQKEKSFLIRRLFEMKSDAANLAKNLPSTASTKRIVNYEKQPSLQLALHQPSITSSSNSSSSSNFYLSSNSYQHQKQNLT